MRRLATLLPAVLTIALVPSPAAAAERAQLVVTNDSTGTYCLVEWTFRGLSGSTGYSLRLTRFAPDGTPIYGSLTYFTTEVGATSYSGGSGTTFPVINSKKTYFPQWRIELFDAGGTSTLATKTVRSRCG